MESRINGTTLEDDIVTACIGHVQGYRGWKSKWKKLPYSSFRLPSASLNETSFTIHLSTPRHFMSAIINPCCWVEDQGLGRSQLEVYLRLAFYKGSGTIMLANAWPNKFAFCKGGVDMFNC